MQQSAFILELALYAISHISHLTSHIPHRALTDSEADAVPRINPSNTWNSLTKEVAYTIVMKWWWKKLEKWIELDITNNNPPTQYAGKVAESSPHSKNNL